MKSLTVNGVRLATVDRGAGQPVLLVHGFPLDHSMWDAQLEVLAADHRVVVPDLRGFGRSQSTAGTVSMEQFADDLASLLDALEVREPVVLCGLSMGGYIAWQFWRRHAARLAGLVLCDTRAAADSPEAAQGRRETADRVLREGPGFLAEQMLPKLLAPATREQRPQIAESLRRVIQAADAAGVAAAQRGMAQRPDATPWLGQIRCPVAVVVGEADAISPVEEMRTLAAAIPGAQFVTIPAAGHMAPVENPAAVNAALLAFLTATRTATGS